MKKQEAATTPVGTMPMPSSFAHQEALQHGRPKHCRNDEFWIRHPPMDQGHRAKIFAPFDALRGFDFRIMEAEKESAKEL